MTDELVVGIIIGLIPPCLGWLASSVYSKMKLRRLGLRVLMITNGRIIETHLVPNDSKIFYWKGGQYVVKEEKIRSSLMGSQKGISLDKREIIFQEGNPEPL